MYARIGIKNKRGKIIVYPLRFNRTQRGFYLTVTETDIAAPDPETADLFIEMQEYDRVAHQEQVLKPVHCIGVEKAKCHGGHEDLFVDYENPQVIPYEKVKGFNIENLILTFGIEATESETLTVPEFKNSTLWHTACLIADPKRHEDMWGKHKGSDYEERLWNYIGSEVSNGSCQATGWTPDPDFIKKALKFRESNPVPNTGNPSLDALDWLKKWDETL